MEHPAAAGKVVDWLHHIHHRASFKTSQTVEEVYGRMLTLGVDYAAVVDEARQPIGLLSFKMVSAALSARYGQALFAKRQLGDTYVPSVIFGTVTDVGIDDQLPLIIPLAQTALIQAGLDFFAAQHLLERRAPERSFDDLIATLPGGLYAGMISMGDFMKMQMDMLRWQESELRRRNVDLNETLNRLSQAQAELVSSAKMAVLGELVAGIAHEMNTPLGVMISSHDMIEKIYELLTPEVSPERRAQLDHHLRTNIDLGREASGRVTQIIRSLRTFGRDDQQEMHPANLSDLITSTLVLLASKFRASINVNTDLIETAQVHCYPGQINQVLVNVLTNAFQAMGGKGDIYIELQRGCDIWELSIRDTGPGIELHHLARLFEPGFTTKGVGVGTGLGLSISRKIIEQNHGGRITAYNHPRGGAVFYMELPFTPPEPGATETQALKVGLSLTT